MFSNLKASGDEGLEPRKSPGYSFEDLGEVCKPKVEIKIAEEDRVVIDDYINQ
jgi:hypothetical protein